MTQPWPFFFLAAFLAAFFFFLAIDLAPSTSALTRFSHPIPGALWLWDRATLRWL